MHAGYAVATTSVFTIAQFVLSYILTMGAGVLLLLAARQLSRLGAHRGFVFVCGIWGAGVIVYLHYSLFEFLVLFLSFNSIVIF